MLDKNYQTCFGVSFQLGQGLLLSFTFSDRRIFSLRKDSGLSGIWTQCSSAWSFWITLRLLLRVYKIWKWTELTFGMCASWSPILSTSNIVLWVSDAYFQNEENFKHPPTRIAFMIHLPPHHSRKSWETLPTKLPNRVTMHISAFAPFSIIIPLSSVLVVETSVSGAQEMHNLIF